MAGASLLALVGAWAGSGDIASAKKLQAALAKAAASSRDSREAREAALKAFKAVQQRLSSAGLGSDAAEQLAGLGRAALAALAAGSGGTGAQLAGWRYNFARRLVSARAYASAHAEARELLCQLNEQAGGTQSASAGGTAATTEAASIAVGTVLTLVLTCVEGRLLGEAKAVDAMLAAADSLPSWLRQLGADEAARHSEACYKYLYKAGMGLLEQRSWQQLGRVCGGLVAAAGGDAAAQRRALAAAAKLVAHMPDEQAATVVAAVAAKVCGEHSSELGTEAGFDLLGMLCSAAQRANSASAARMLSEAALSCSRSTPPLLRVAPLLLPAMALQLPPPEHDPDWLEPVSTAVRLVNTSLEQLQAPLPCDSAQQHVAMLQAAYHPANVLRRSLAAQLAASDRAAAAAGCGGDVCERLGGPAASSLVAAALELLAGAVGVGRRQPHDGTSSTLGSQGHAAAVALVTAARLRAVCLLQQAGHDAASDHGEMERTETACGWLLGWSLQQFHSARSELPPAACAVEPQELSWMASALFNVGLDLHAAQRHAAAAPALRAAAAVAAVGLQVLAKGSPPAEDKATRLADFCRKCAVLASAQQQAGGLAGALGSLGHSLALLLRLGIAQPAAWHPLVEAFVRLQCEAAQEQMTAVEVVSAAPQPARRGRGAASKKAAGSTSAAGLSAASSSQASGCDTLLVQLLQQHEADLPSCSIAAVLEHELLCWGAALQGDGLAQPAAVSTAVSRLIKSLLQEVVPAKAQPVLHATALLALHKAGLPTDDGQCGLALLERATAALSKVPGEEAHSLLAQARCWQAVHAGRQHACQVLVEQQQERQRSHAAASTSAASSREQDAAVLGQLAGSTAGHAAAWQRVVQQAELAVEMLESAGRTTPTPPEFEELAWLLGLRGRDAAAHQLSLLLPGSMQPVGGALASCLFPSASASAAELQQRAEEAAAEASRASIGSAMQRAALHGQAAEACAAAGDMVPALFHAAEAHRLLAVLFHRGSDAAGAGPANAARPGWWRLAAAYLGSLLQLGQLFEAAGQADEALHSLREGQRLAVAAGAAPMAAAFAARMADVLCKQGELEAAEQAAAAAEQQLDAVPDSSALALAYCKAAVQLVRAQLRLAAAGGCPGKAVWQACQAAVASCEALVANTTNVAAAAGSFCAALHAAALLTLAEAANQQDDAAGARQHAAAALQVADAGGACSAVCCQHAAALVFLGRHAASGAAAEQHLSIWGLGATGCGSSASGGADSAAAPKSRASKQPASRGRNKAAAAAAAAEDFGSSNANSMQQEHMQRLWQALECSRGILPAYREAATLLAVECGRLGYLHLAALLLHCALGAALQLQYQLVLFSRRQQLAQRQRRGMGAGDAASELPAQLQQLERLSAVLQPHIDRQLVQQLSLCSSASTSKPAAASASRGRRAPAAAAAAGVPPSAAALAALEQQAARQLQAWLASLPADTAACSISTLPGSQGGSILISRLSPAAPVGEPLRPPLLVVLPVQQLSASLSQHPIRALRLDDDAADEACSAGVSSVQSVLDEMAAVLAESGRSMREMSTETKEQQREWWRARLALDDRLAALTKHLGSSWLGPWRSLLLGTPPGSSGSSSQVGEAAAQHLAGLLTLAGQPASEQQANVLRHAAALLAQHARSMSQGELRQAAHQLCVAAGLACSQEQQRQLEDLLLAVPAAGHDAEAEVEAAEAAAAPLSKARRAGKSVKFADVAAAEQQAEEGKDPVVSAASSKSAGRGRRPAAARGRRGAAAAAAAAEELAAESSTSGGGDASPVATLAAVGGGADMPMAAGGGLCQALDALSLADAPAPATAAPAPATGPAGVGTTTRSGKHRSRLRMLQAGTPGPATARKTAAAAGAATAPRPARELPLTVAKTAPPPASRSSGAGDSGAAAAADGGPVLLVLDGALQALPWESAAGLVGQRLYRMPNLASAAASAQRASTSVDLSSTFYALNPSGDLATTQATFQDWFRGMKGWEGKAGCAPTAAELAAALQRHAFFLYCGHGGGEQYISVTKLRSLERCSAALLMGCSSGRLRAQQHYEPAGAVLAYLLAGCPAAVANLWDVTDRDIDRFSQAVLTAYISAGGSGSAPGSRGSRIKGGIDDENSEPLGTDMSAAVGASRGVCKLPHLVGAAPVCYGLPSRAFLG